MGRPGSPRPEPRRTLPSPAPSGPDCKPHEAPARPSPGGTSLRALTRSGHAGASPWLALRILLPRTASRLTTGGHLISAATPAELRAPPARRLPRGPPLARALALPHSLRPFPRPPLLLAPLPSASPARLPSHSAPRQSGVRFGPFQFQSCGSSESPPQPSPPPQPQGSRVPMGRRADGLGRGMGWGEVGLPRPLVKA